MRKRIYLPQKIDSMKTQLAVETLIYALWENDVCSLKEAEERICQLLEQMCKQNSSEKSYEDISEHFFDKLKNYRESSLI